MPRFSVLLNCIVFILVGQNASGIHIVVIITGAQLSYAFPIIPHITCVLPTRKRDSNFEAIIVDHVSVISVRAMPNPHISFHCPLKPYPVKNLWFGWEIHCLVSGFLVWGNEGSSLEMPFNRGALPREGLLCTLEASQLVDPSASTCARSSGDTETSHLVLRLSNQSLSGRTP